MRFRHGNLKLSRISALIAAVTSSALLIESVAKVAGMPLLSDDWHACGVMLVIALGIIAIGINLTFDGQLERINRDKLQDRK